MWSYCIIFCGQGLIMYILVNTSAPLTLDVVTSNFEGA